HRSLCVGTDGGMGCAVERDDRGSRPEDRAPAPTLHRGDAPRLRALRSTLGSWQSQSEARALAEGAVEGHVATHRAGKPARNGKAEAGAPFLRVCALETLEN